MDDERKFLLNRKRNFNFKNNLIAITSNGCYFDLTKKVLYDDYSDFKNAFKEDNNFLLVRQHSGGYYVEKVEDYLVVYLFGFECNKWNEISRAVISIEGNSFSMLKKKNFFDYYCDIFDDENKIDISGRFSYLFSEYLDGDSMKAVFDFLEDKILYLNQLENNFISPVFFINNLHNIDNIKVKTFEPLDMSPVFFNRGKCLFSNSFIRDVKMFSNHVVYKEYTEGKYFAAIDAKNNILRIFYFYADFSSFYSNHYDVFDDATFELKNVLVKEAYRFNFDDVDEIITKFSEQMEIFIIFYDKDNIEESSLKYFKDIFINYNNRIKKLKKSSFSFLRNRDFSNNYFLSVKNFCFLVKEPFLEKIYKSNYQFLKEMVIKYVFDVVDLQSLKNSLGGLDLEEKSLNRILQVPVYFLEKLNKRFYSAPEIYYGAKGLFEDNIDYFLRLNNSDIDILIEDTSFLLCNSWHNMLALVKKLVSIFGVENWKNYFLFFKDILKKGKDFNYSDYSDYLEKLLALGDLAKDAEWKVMGDDLVRANESILPAYYCVCDKTVYAEQLAAFERQQNSWKNYEYEDDNYLITYPRRPSELITEGLSLHHCVKTFIDAVAEEISTILFIRKKDNKDKPYFTLEIRNGEIRQCHGNTNIDMSFDNELVSFVGKFCKEKNVTFSEGSSALGA